ncbi:MAG: InlB B-repeat-containing protein [Clostridia bacterium]|nr:InlB B-repeat-containing protein [Clostridia bacterium]
MTRTRKIIAALVTALMLLTVLPAAAFAESAALKLDEITTRKHWEKVWAPLDEVEAEMLAKGAAPAECTLAVYKAALENPDIDKGSITDLDANSFSFTTKGMHGGYDYKIRNIPHVSSLTPEVMEVIIHAAAVKAEATKDSNSPSSPNVLLVNPYYGSDSSFTNQYILEAQSIAAATGGTYTALTGTNATGPNIAAAYTDKGVVIYDSHGNCISSNQTSYLDLRSSSGLTSNDYNNGWAYNGGSFYGIDGRYILNHASGTLSNCIVWMAICEGMKKEGKGTTGTALLQAGAGVVYGYSQSVTFTGDYAYEETFWTEMKNGETVASAIATMKSVHGNWDPAYSSSSGAAWPIVMSSVDAFPSNPDGVQTVYSDWTLFSVDPEPIESVSVADIMVEAGGTAQAALTVTPRSADYTVTSWSTANTGVATVSSSGLVTGVRTGSTTLTVTVHDNIAGTNFTATAPVTVVAQVRYELADSIESGAEYIIVAQSSISGTSGSAVGNYIISSSGHYLTPVAVTINSDSTCSVSAANASKVLWRASGSASDGWAFYNEEVGKYMGLDSSQYLNLTASALYWTYTSSKWLDNGVDSDGYYYLSYSTNPERYTTGKSSSSSNYVINLYKKVVVGEPEPQTLYTVTFVDWNGTVLSTQQVEEGAAAAAPADPVRTGYTFTGWDVPFDCVTSDLTVTAQYSINSYTLTISYVYANGSQAAPAYTGVFEYGAAYSVVSPAVDGFTPDRATVTGSMSAGDVTVTVTYTAVPAEPTLPGDLNGDGMRSFDDVSLLAAHIVGVAVLDGQALANADVNGDGAINSLDISYLYNLILNG